MCLMCVGGGGEGQNKVYISHKKQKERTPRDKKQQPHTNNHTNHTPTTTPTTHQPHTNHRRLTFSFTRMGFFQPFIASKHNAMLFQITDGTCHYFFSSFTVAMAFFQLCCCNPNLQFRWQFFSGIVKDLFGSTKEEKKGRKFKNIEY